MAGAELTRFLLDQQQHVELLRSQHAQTLRAHQTASEASMAGLSNLFDDPGPGGPAPGRKVATTARTSPSKQWNVGDVDEAAPSSVLTELHAVHEATAAGTRAAEAVAARPDDEEWPQEITDLWQQYDARHDRLSDYAAAITTTLQGAGPAPA
jgi:hypothetical protein